MGEHLYKNWIIYVLLIGFVWFVMSVYRSAWRDENRKKQGEAQKKNVV